MPLPSPISTQLNDVCNNDNTRCLRTATFYSEPCIEPSAVDEGNLEEFAENERILDCFQNATDEVTELCWQDLQKILTNTMQKEFPKEMCRSLIAMVDRNHSGSLCIEQLRNLHATVKHWNNVFRKFSLINSGLQSAHQLRAALACIGYELNDHILDNLICRFSNKNGQMEIDDFLMCAIRVKTVIDIYKDKDHGNLKCATFTFDEWMKKTLYL